jgi:hypothetical protein
MSSRSARNDPSAVALAATEVVQVVLTGPSMLHSEASSPFTIQVENQAGTPVSTSLNYRVYDATGAVTWQDTTSTDESGTARFDVDAGVARKASRLELATDDASPAPIQRDLETAPEQFVTYLRMDRPLYQPGEQVFYRSVTLSRYALRSNDEVMTSFEIVDSNDKQLEGTMNTVATEQGVGSGTFELPSDLTDGTYTLIASSPDNLFSEEWRDFHVRRYEKPRLLKKLELARDSYTAGDQVDFDFSVKRAAGEPLAELPLQIQATVDGLSLATPKVTTDAKGNSRFSVTLPESIERGEASVSVLVREGEDPPETITKHIPINLGKVNVDFYPEGGDLAAGLPSRVYFYGRDPLGKPTHIEGRVVGSKGDEIADVATSHEGRGVFSFTPVDDEQYRLILEKPVGVTKEVPLPATSPIRFATIETGEGVFDANAPITFTLYQRVLLKPLIVAAYCRGAMVGQQNIEPDAYAVDQAEFATFRGELNLPPQAQGVVRLTVFDATPTPPEPIAERLVYRRVGQKLDVRLTPDAETFAPGQSVELELAVHDENNAPVPAMLGIAIVDDAILNLAEDKSTRMPTYFHLLTEIDSPQQLEDANFYLSDKAESVAALDSLLGTQGWRRFRDLPSTQLAQAGRGGFGGGGAGLSFGNSNLGRRFVESVAWDKETVVPLSTVTTMDVREISLPQVTQAARAVSWRRESFASPIIIVSIVLLVLVSIASLRWARSNRSLRLLAGVVAVVSLLVGVASLPNKPIRVSQVTDNAMPEAGEVAVAFDKEGVIAADDIVTMGEEAGAVGSESFMLKTDSIEKSSDSDEVAMAAEAFDYKPSGQLKTAPKQAARFAEEQKRLSRANEPEDRAKSTDLFLGKEKDAPMPISESQPSPAASASAEKPQPIAGTSSARPMMRAQQLQQLQSLADDVGKEFLTREYATWFYRDRFTIPPTDQSASTIVWLPLHQADQTGKATVYFNLPQRPSSFRAIVEAHAAGWLGAGELLIDSRGQ